MDCVAHDLSEPSIHRIDGRRCQRRRECDRPRLHVGRPDGRQALTPELCPNVLDVSLRAADCPRAPGSVALKPRVAPLPDRRSGCNRIYPRPGHQGRRLPVEPLLSLDLLAEVAGMFLARAVPVAGAVYPVWALTDACHTTPSRARPAGIRACVPWRSTSAPCEPLSRPVPQKSQPPDLSCLAQLLRGKRVRRHLRTRPLTRQSEG